VRRRIFPRLDGGGTADGGVTADNVEDFARFNFSGRSKGMNWDAGDLEACLNRYDPQNLRWWVEENHDVRKIADAYLELVGERALAAKA